MPEFGVVYPTRTWRPSWTPDLDTLAAALYVTTDDLLTAHPERVPVRPRVGIAPQISDAEMLTLAVMGALLGYTSEARWLRYAQAHLLLMFPQLPSSRATTSGYEKLAAHDGLAGPGAGRPNQHAADDVWVVDSTPVECARSRETVQRSDLAGSAEYGYCASHSRFFWGLRLHLVCTLHGLPIGWALTGAKPTNATPCTTSSPPPRSRPRSKPAAAKP